MGNLTRVCLDVERALRLGRFKPKTLDEIRLVVGWALDDGFTLDPGWSQRWDSFARNRPYLSCYHALYEDLLVLDVKITELAYIVAAEKGYPYRPTEKKAPIHDAGEMARKRTALRGSFSSRVLCDDHGYYRQKLIDLRDRGQLLAFAIPGDCAFYYPAWQFNESMKPSSLVSLLIPLLETTGRNKWDLQYLMKEEATFRGKRQSLEAIAIDPGAFEWIVGQVSSRFRTRSRRGV